MRSQTGEPSPPADTGTGTVEATAAGAAARADALAAEYAAIFAYGPIGVRLPEDLTATAREAETAHRDRRDALVLALTGEGLDPPGPEPGYALPFEVTDADSALRLAVLVEERVAAVWRAVLPETTGAARAEALDALADAAIRATGWRAAAGIEPATVPFPGRP